MAFADFLKSLTPRDKKFIPLFTGQVVTLEASLAVFEKLLNVNDLQKRIEYVTEIKNLEREGDKKTINISEELHSSFITPFDREDIYLLANQIDSVIDYLNSASQKIMIYKYTETPAEFKEMTKYLHNAVQHLKVAIEGLENLKDVNKIKMACYKISDEEKLGDVTYHKFISALFENEKDAIKLIKTKDIFEAIEESLDTCKDIAVVLMRVIVKNS